MNVNQDARLSAEELPDDRTRARMAVMDLDKNDLVDAEEWKYYREAMVVREWSAGDSFGRAW